MYFKIPHAKNQESTVNPQQSSANPELPQNTVLPETHRADPP
jgi:hypothetical protein